MCVRGSIGPFFCFKSGPRRSAQTCHRERAQQLALSYCRVSRFLCVVISFSVRSSSNVTHSVPPNAIFRAKLASRGVEELEQLHANCSQSALSTVRGRSWRKAGNVCAYSLESTLINNSFYSLCVQAVSAATTKLVFRSPVTNTSRFPCRTKPNCD